MSSVSLFAGMMIQSLGRALLLSLLQGLLVYGCLRLVLFVARRASARIRYHLGYSALVLLFGWFILTWLQQWERLKGISIQVTEAAGTQTLKTYVLATNPSGNNDNYGLTDLLLRAEQYIPLLVTLYFFGLVFMSIRLVIGWRSVRTLRSEQLRPVPDAWQELLQQLSRKLGLNRRPGLFASLKASTPMVIGALKPVILLPVSALTQLNPYQLEAILVHELAHIKRHDYLLNLFQTLVETLLCFNPFVWLIGAGIRREREHCCDDLVVTLTERPLPYAQALATLEAQRLQSADKLAMAVTGQKQHLFQRIKRIMEMKRPSPNNNRLVFVLVFAVGITTCLALLSPSWAQRNKSAAEPLQGDSVRRQRIIIEDSDGTRKEYTDVEDLPRDIKEKVAGSLRQARDADKISRKALDQSLAALSAVDFKEIDRSVQQALDEVKPEEISADVQEALDAIDWKSINKEIAQATAEVEKIDWNEIQKEIDKGLSEAHAALNDPALKKEIRDKIKEAQKQAQRDIARAGREASREVERAQREAGREIERAQREAERARERAQREASIGRQAGRDAAEAAREQTREAREKAEEARDQRNANRAEMADPVPDPKPAPAITIHKVAPAAPITPFSPAPPKATGGRYEEMLQRMDKEGLIDREGKFTIRKENGCLSINGEKQNADVCRKYAPYIGNDEKVIIKGSASSLKISVTNND